MVPFLLLFPLKLASGSFVANNMVNFEVTKRLAPSLITSGRQWIFDSVHNAIANRLSAPSASKDESGLDQQQQHRQKQQQEASTEYLVLNWLESMFSLLQIVALWHEPFLSVGTIFGLSTLFLLFTYFAPRFYATILILLFVYNLFRFWFKHIWPEIRVKPSAEREAEMRLDVDRFTYLHPQLMTLNEFKVHLEIIWEIIEMKLIGWLIYRSQKPQLFFVKISAILYITATIGTMISGFDLILSFIGMCLLIPGVYCHLLPVHLKEWIQQTYSTELDKAREAKSRGLTLFNYMSPTTTSSGDGRLNLEKEKETTTKLAYCTKSQTISILDQIKSLGFVRRTSASNRVSEHGDEYDDDDDELNGEEEIEGVDEGQTTGDTHGNRNKYNNQEKTTTSVVTATTVSPNIDVPLDTQEDNKRLPTRHRSSLQAYYEEDEDDEIDTHNNETNRRSSNLLGELSSNSSVSLIESDDEQHDGFVLL